MKLKISSEKQTFQIKKVEKLWKSSERALSVVQKTNRLLSLPVDFWLRSQKNEKHYEQNNFSRF